MGSSFYIRIPDATEIDEGYGRFACDINDVVEGAAASVDALVSLDSLSGKGAEAIKAYFTEVHYPLLYMLTQLVRELDTVYNSPYYQGLLSAAKNDGAGEFPSWDLWDKARAFQQYADGNVPPIDNLMRSALQAAPSGYSFHTPSTSAFRNAMGSKSRKLDTTRENFENAESAGVSALTDADDVYQKLYHVLSDAIARCANGVVSMTSYKSGDFRTAMNDLGLQQISIATHESQEAKSDVVIAMKQKGAENRALDIERARQKAEEAKRAWAIGGEVLQVVILGAAVAGLVVATGGVAIAFAAVGVASAAYGTYQRGKQLSNMKSDARSDIDKSDGTAKTLKGLKDVKDYGKGMDKTLRNAELFAKVESSGMSDAGKAHYGGGAYNNAANAASNTFVSIGTKVVGDYVDEQFGDQLEGHDKMVYKEIKKGTEKTIEKGSEALIDKALPKMKVPRSVTGGSILDYAPESWNATTSVQKTVGKAAGWVGFAAGCGQIYTDYQVEQYDQALDKCESDRQNNESYRQSISSGSSYEWAVQW